MSEDRPPQAAESPPPAFDQAQIKYALDQLRNEQNLVLGTAAGVVAVLVGAGLWGLITTLTKFQIGWMAVGVGFLVGLAMRALGKGVDKIFGVVGATLALLGCALGNLLAVCGLISVEQDRGFFEVLSRLDPSLVAELMIATFSPIDLLFYGVAVYEGYKLSLRQLTEQEIAARITGSPGATAG